MSILIVGECLSHKDEGEPFADGNGRFFKALLSQSGIDPRHAEFINLFPQTPPSGRDVSGFFGPKANAPKHIKFFKKNKYIQNEHWHHVLRCRELILHKKPNLVLAVGAAPVWALTTEKNVKNARGRVVSGNSALPDQKILPVYSPQMVQADWSQKPILMADLAKARREMEFPEIRRPPHYIHLYPTLEDLEDFLNQYIIPSEELSVDIETKGAMITCVGFAPSTERALVVPFYCESNPDGNYWPDVRTEVLAWNWCKRVLHLQKRVKGQNFQYDIQHLWRLMGIPTPYFSEDTMLMHHAMQPEMPKSLGFLGSIYTNEPPWKFMHKLKSADRSGKKEDNE